MYCSKAIKWKYLVRYSHMKFMATKCVIWFLLHVVNLNLSLHDECRCHNNESINVAVLVSFSCCL